MFHSFAVVGNLFGHQEKVILYLLIACLVLAAALRIRAKCYNAGWAHVFGLSSCECYERGRLEGWNAAREVDCLRHGKTAGIRKCASCELDRSEK